VDNGSDGRSNRDRGDPRLVPRPQEIDEGRPLPKEEGMVVVLAAFDDIRKVAKSRGRRRMLLKFKVVRRVIDGEEICSR
jgi:hypothetical protein